MSQSPPVDAAMPSPPPDAQLLQLILGMFTSRALGVAAELGLADLLKDGPLGLEELSARSGAAPDALYRMLRALAAVEMLVMTHGGRERTEQEYAALLERAGLEFARLIPTRSPVSVVEAFAGSRS